MVTVNKAINILQNVKYLGMYKIYITIVHVTNQVFFFVLSEGFVLYPPPPPGDPRIFIGSG